MYRWIQIQSGVDWSSQMLHWVQKQVVMMVFPGTSFSFFACMKRHNELTWVASAGEVSGRLFFRNCRFLSLCTLIAFWRRLEELLVGFFFGSGLSSFAVSPVPRCWGCRIWTRPIHNVGKVVTPGGTSYLSCWLSTTWLKHPFQQFPWYSSLLFYEILFSYSLNLFPDLAVLFHYTERKKKATAVSCVLCWIFFSPFLCCALFFKGENVEVKLCLTSQIIFKE